MRKAALPAISILPILTFDVFFDLCAARFCYVWLLAIVSVMFVCLVFVAHFGYVCMLGLITPDFS